MRAKIQNPKRMNVGHNRTTHSEKMMIVVKGVTRERVIHIII